MTHDLLVYERRPRYAAALSRCGDLSLQQVRSVSQLREAIQAKPRSVVAVEIRADTLVQVANVCWWAKSRFQVALIAMRSADLAAFDRPLLEAGIDVLFRSHLDLPSVARLVRRHRPHAQHVLSPPRSPRKQLWQRIPWKRYATGR